MKEIVNNIYVTDDYSIFKLMDSNRGVDECRKNKVKKSVESIGYLSSSPIIVNENYEIIDGQCRFLICKELGSPIYFAIQPGAGIKECISMNISGTPWKMIDYIKSYVSLGNENYKYLLTQIETFPQIRPTVIIAICADTAEANNTTIQNGTYKVAWDKTIDIKKTLTFINDEIPILKKIAGSIAKMSLALAFAYRHSSADNERLKKCIGEVALTAQMDQVGVATTSQALQMIENAYNNRLAAKNRIRLCIEYEDFLSGKFDWYQKKWGDRHNREW